MAKQGPFDTRIGGSTEGILGFVYVEFQCFSGRGSSHQSLLSAKSGCVEGTAMYFPCQIRYVFSFVVLQFTFVAISVLWLIFMA